MEILSKIAQSVLKMSLEFFIILNVIVTKAIIIIKIIFAHYVIHPSHIV